MLSWILISSVSFSLAVESVVSFTMKFSVSFLEGESDVLPPYQDDSSPDRDDSPSDQDDFSSDRDDSDSEEPVPYLVRDFIDDADFARRFRALTGEDGKLSFCSIVFVHYFSRLFRLWGYLQKKNFLFVSSFS